MLSNTSKYAIRAMIYLAMNAQNNTRIGIKKIADDLKIPSPFLAKILQLLARHKILTSTKGPNGGFGIGADPYKITLYKIVTLMEGDDVFEKCLISLRICNEENTPCAVHEKYETIRKSIRTLFNEMNLGILVKDIKTRNHFLAI